MHLNPKLLAVLSEGTTIGSKMPRLPFSTYVFLARSDDMALNTGEGEDMDINLWDAQEP